MHAGICFALALVASAATRHPEEAVVAFWRDGHGLVGDAAEVRREVESILSDAGVRLVWQDADREPAPSGVLQVDVVVSPSEPGGAGWHLPPSAMGVYLATPESSAVFVFYHRVAKVLGVPSEKDGMLAPSDRRRLAKALGRVVVHELVHRVAPDLPHAYSGIMRSDLGRSLLLRSRLDLDHISRSVFFTALREARLREASNHLSPGPRTK